MIKSEIKDFEYGKGEEPNKGQLIVTSDCPTYDLLLLELGAIVSYIKTQIDKEEENRDALEFALREVIQNSLGENVEWTDLN